MTKTEKRELAKLRSDANRNKITDALKLIAKALNSTDDPMAQYKIRRVRYGLLKNNGVKCSMTYPRPNYDSKGNLMPVAPPMVIRHIGHSGTNATVFTSLDDSLKVSSTKRVKERKRLAKAA
jgi:hypothetical protein